MRACTRSFPFRIRTPFGSTCCAVGSACFSYLFGWHRVRRRCGVHLRLFFAGVPKTPSIAARPLNSSSIWRQAPLWRFAPCCCYRGLGDSLDKIIIGSIIRLVPGVALTTSIRDSLNGDYLSGTIRAIDAFLVGGCIAIGVGAVVMTYISLTGRCAALMTPEAVSIGQSRPRWRLWQPSRFSIISIPPREQYVCAGLVGAFSWLIYIVYVYFYGRCCVRVVFAALGLTYLARVLASACARAHARVPHQKPEFFPCCARRRYLLYGLSHFREQQRRGNVHGETIEIAPLPLRFGIGIVVSLPRFFFTLRRKGSTA